MKKSIFTFVIVSGTMLAMVTGCQTQADRIDNAQGNVMEAKQEVRENKRELAVIRQDSVNEFQKFKLNAEETIKNNEIRIAELKTANAELNKENDAKYQERVAKLEQKNKDLKKKLSEYKDDGADNWEAFTTEFNRDMNELGKSLKAFVE